MKYSLVRGVIMNVKDAVIASINELLKEEGKKLDVNMDTPISRETGIDSLGFVSLIIEIEERLDVSLENVIVEIRKCRFVKDLVCVIENFIQK